MIIENKTGKIGATIDAGPESVIVMLYESRRTNGADAFARIHTTELDCPFHVALNRIHDLVWSL